ncbi:unnamed protein product, partial [Larinioides sclopetarius]
HKQEYNEDKALYDENENKSLLDFSHLTTTRGYIRNDRVNPTSYPVTYARSKFAMKQRGVTDDVINREDENRSDQYISSLTTAKTYIQEVRTVPTSIETSTIMKRTVQKFKDFQREISIPPPKKRTAKKFKNFHQEKINSPIQEEKCPEVQRSPTGKKKQSPDPRRELSKSSKTSNRKTSIPPPKKETV